MKSSLKARCTRIRLILFLVHDVVLENRASSVVLVYFHYLLPDLPNFRVLVCNVFEWPFNADGIQVLCNQKGRILSKVCVHVLQLPIG